MGVGLELVVVAGVGTLGAGLLIEALGAVALGALLGFAEVRSYDPSVIHNLN